MRLWTGARSDASMQCWRMTSPPDIQLSVGCQSQAASYWELNARCWRHRPALQFAVTRVMSTTGHAHLVVRRRPPEIILFQRVETCLKLFQNYFAGLLQLMNIFQHVQCRWNNFEIISELRAISTLIPLPVVVNLSPEIDLATRISYKTRIFRL